MLRLLVVAAAALCTVINADETVTLKRDAPPAEESRASRGFPVRRDAEAAKESRG